jgi:hypothetical protein
VLPSSSKEAGAKKLVVFDNGGRGIEAVFAAL